MQPEPVPLRLVSQMIGKFYVRKSRLARENQGYDKVQSAENDDIARKSLLHSRK
jgi:hypothetical protein